jgi:NAD(P)-dependent dehydrogenase (short-subunit alcohol dehydrogenase family)
MLPQFGHAQVIYAIGAIVFVFLWWNTGLFSFATLLLLLCFLVVGARELADVLIKKYQVGVRVNLDDGASTAVLVTGASRGIGKAVALRLYQDGFDVFAGVRKSEDGEALEKEALTLKVGEAGKRSGTLRHVVLDVLSDASVANAVEVITKQVGEKGLAILVNNAGCGVPPVPIEILDLEVFDSAMQLNFLSTVRVTKAFLPLLRKACHLNNGAKFRPRIINMSSIMGLLSGVCTGAYAPSKWALEAFSTALRLEVSPTGIDVIVLNPGPIKTELLGQVIESLNGDKLCKILNDKGVPWYIGSGLPEIFESSNRKVTEDELPVSTVSDVVSYIARVNHRDLRTRYTVGKDLPLICLLVGILPERVWEWFFTPLQLLLFPGKKLTKQTK